MAKKIYIDPEGRAIPPKYVSPYDKARDRIARQIHADWEKEEDRLRKLKARTQARIQALRELAANDSDVKLGGSAGYLQFRSFDGKTIIRLENVKQYEFDEKMEMALQLINEAIDDMSGKAKRSRSVNVAQLRKIATAAFQPRGKNGKLDRQRVLDITRLDIDHPKWRRACELIREAERVTGHRQYIRVATMEGLPPKQLPIILDISKV